MPGLSATNITLETIASVYDGVPETSSISLSEYYRVSATGLYTNNVDLYDDGRIAGPPYDIHVRPEVSTVPIISNLETPVSAQLPISFSDFSNTNNKSPTASKKIITGILTGVKGAADTIGYNVTDDLLFGSFGSVDNRYMSVPGVTASTNYYNRGINQVTQTSGGVFTIGMTPVNTSAGTSGGNGGWSNIKLFDSGGTKQVSINRTAFGTFEVTAGVARWAGTTGGSWLQTRPSGTSVTMEFN